MGEDHHSNLTTNDLVNVLCMKWGNKYPADYVNRLYSMVARNMQRPFRFICLTEDSVGLVKILNLFHYLSYLLTLVDLSEAGTSSPFLQKSFMI